jgi:hypothetical protein
MSIHKKKDRLTRVIKALEMLHTLELSRQTEAITQRIAATTVASEIDAIDIETSTVWSLFPQSWLNFRSKIDQDMTEYATKATLAADEARRIEKAVERFSELVLKLDAVQVEKQSAEEIFDFISSSSLFNKSALGKFAKIDMLVIDK